MERRLDGREGGVVGSRRDREERTREGGRRRGDREGGRRRGSTRAGVPEIGREGVRELGSGGLAPLFGEYGVGLGGITLGIGEYVTAVRPTTMLGR